MAVEIHPSAIVHPGARLGQDVRIGPYAIVEDHVDLGDGSVIDAFATIKSHVSLGRENHIHSYACIGGDPQDIKYKGEATRLSVGDRNIFREFVTFNRGTVNGGGLTTIGSDSLFMAYVHVAHDCKVGDKVIFSNGVTLGGHVHVGSNTIIGGLSAVHQFVRIGEYAFIGGKTGVVQDIPPYMLAAGERAKLHGPNLVGLRRMPMPPETIHALKTVYRLLWRSNGLRQDAIAEAMAKLGGIPEVVRVIEFVQSSERGVTSSD
jgi:UDP-N-acetylglucosamine acyltransferase